MIEQYISIAEQLKKIQTEAKTEILAAQDLNSLESMRVKYLGRNGLLPQLMKKIGSLPEEEKPKVGKLTNECKGLIEEAWQEKHAQLKQDAAMREDRTDLTMPACPFFIGHKHPVTLIMEEAYKIFAGLGFGIAEGPEIESDYYNFEALNFPKEHPARDMHDSFYISEDVLLRTHTSPVQVRIMEKTRPPIRIIAPGKVYRRDADVTHSPMFHQIEGLLVDTSSSFSELKGILTAFVHQMFDPQTSLRFRPSFFPFTEPSAEVDLLWVDKDGKESWIEMGGCGMVDPNVFDAVGIDSERYTGWAFGFGIERLAMRKFGITDIRLFYENDIRFLQQF